MDKEVLRKRNRKWVLEHPDKWKEHQKRYRDKNRELLNKRARERYRKFKINPLSREECIERAQIAFIRKRKKVANEILKTGFKECTKCKKIKSIEMFFYDARCFHGLQAQCKECYKEKSKLRSIKMKINNLKKYGNNCKLCNKNLEIEKYAIHHLSYDPAKEIILCRECHNTLHCLRIHRLDLIRKYGSDLAPYEWAKQVIDLYENN